MIISFFTPLLSSLIHKSVLGKLDQVLGFIFGVLRGIALIAIAFFAYSAVLNSQSIPDGGRKPISKGVWRYGGPDRGPQSRTCPWLGHRAIRRIGLCL